MSHLGCFDRLEVDLLPCIVASVCEDPKNGMARGKPWDQTFVPISHVHTARTQYTFATSAHIRSPSSDGTGPNNPLEVLPPCHRYIPPSWNTNWRSRGVGTDPAGVTAASFQGPKRSDLVPDRFTEPFKSDKSHVQHIPNQPKRIAKGISYSV